MIRHAWTAGIAAIVLTSGLAQAQGVDRGLGLGTNLAPSSVLGIGPTGSVHLAWDPGNLQLEGTLSFAFVEDDATTFSLGGRAYVPVARAKQGDLSVGGELGLGLVAPDQGDSGLFFALGGGARIRSFISPSIALTVAAGLQLGFVTEDIRRNTVALSGGLFGNAGLTFFFGK